MSVNNNLDTSNFVHERGLIDPEYMLTQKREGYSRSPTQYIRDMNENEYSTLGRENMQLNFEHEDRLWVGRILGSFLGGGLGGGLGVLWGRLNEQMGYAGGAAILLGYVGGWYLGGALAPICRSLPSATKIEIDRESRLNIKIGRISEKILQLKETNKDNWEIEKLEEAQSYFEIVLKKFQ